MKKRLENFLYRPASPRPLASLRIGIALVLLIQAALLTPVFYELYASGGVMAGESAARTLVPGLGGWLAIFAHLGLPEDFALGALGVAYVASLAALALGWHTRASSIAAWGTHMILTRGENSIYGVDAFANAILFFLMFFPCGAVWSLDAREGRAPAPEPWSARLSLRTVQIYLCIAYLATGLEKAVGPQWWTGEAIWRAMMLPTFSQFDVSWMARVPWLPKIGGWLTLLTECGYAFFIWPRLTRRLWIVLTLSLHFGIAIFLGLQLFGVLMMVLTFSVWGVPAEPGVSLAAYWASAPWGKRRASSLASPALAPAARAS